MMDIESGLLWDVECGACGRWHVAGMSMSGCVPEECTGGVLKAPTILPKSNLYA